MGDEGCMWHIYILAGDHSDIFIIGEAIDNSERGEEKGREKLQGLHRI